MQFIAMLTMLIDHIGLFFMPDAWGLRAIGRIAFPIYAYLIVRGMDRTRDRGRYAARLAVLAVAAEVSFLLLDVGRHNVIFTLLAGLLLLWALDRYKVQGPRSWLFIGLTGAACELMQFDYGAYGIVLMALYRYLSGGQLLAGHAILTAAAILAGRMSELQVLSVLSTALIVFWPRLDAIRVPPWLWRLFYPAHLAVIALIRGL